MPGSSVFFPTFRRIEGGYSLERQRWPTRLPHENALEVAIAAFSENLDTGAHHFVASISTNDIVALLNARYARILQTTNRLHRELSEFITTTIHGYENTTKAALEQEKLASAQSTLSKIQERISAIEEKRNKLLRPFAVLGELVGSIFHYRGIKVSDAITFGKPGDSITSDKLSAGEKQMLSFLCYNAFSSDCCIFIDEPEISLHVDWQRTLFPTLLEQSTSNQFIIATHSPFIYSKFPDKEILLNPDRGEG
jgi:predicted ATPase